MSTQITISDAALEAMLARRAHRADPGDLRDEAFALIDAVEPRRSWLGWTRAPRRSAAVPAAVPAALWLLLLAGLLLAMVVGSLAAGAFQRDLAVVPPMATPTPVATGVEVLPPGPRGFTKMVALSSDEIWALDRSSVWHFLDGAWSSEAIDVGRWHSVVLASDGTPWAAGAEGTAYWRDGRWVVVDVHGTLPIAGSGASTIAVGPDGTVWVAGSERGCHLWRLRPSGDSWTSTAVEGCPGGFFSGGALTSVALDGRGAVWVGGHGFVSHALARYADRRWETTAVQAGLPDFMAAEILGVSAMGDLWIRFQASGGSQAARYDGTTWTVLPASEIPLLAAAAAPGAASWAATFARYDWKVLEDSNPSVVPPLTPLVVAPDGTAFAVDGDGRFVRLPAPSTSP